MNAGATSLQDAYDVVILGGGLAGLCLALQLKQARPETSVLVVEKARHPVPEAAHKVGESSVEIGAHYFTRVLGQIDHFRSDQLPKLGLRYFFDGPGVKPANIDLTDRTELGGNTFFPTPSFQIDRGRFENHLGEQIRAAGAHLLDGAAVRGVELAEDSGPHRVSIEAADGDTAQVQARWVVDASGRSSLLKRKLKLGKKNNHDVNSVWWRYDRRIKVDDWSTDARWHDHTGGSRQRWLSTVHLMGAGYWVWLIPLASGSHSIGIVADQKLHPFSTLSTYEKAMAWLEAHEPQCCSRLRAVEADGGQLQDFLGYKDFSYSCQQVYDAPHRWALVGEAGPFLDPFYSPGSDYIGLGNTFVTDLIRRDLAGEKRLATRSEVYNRIFFNFYDNHLSLYEGQMPMWGNARVMALKIIWDFAYYWVLPAAFFFHGYLTDMMLYAEHRDRLDGLAALNRSVQALFRAWHEAGTAAGHDRPSPGFVNIPGVPFMYELNRGLGDTLDRDAFVARLVANLALLDRVAGEIASAARQDVPAVDLGPLASHADASGEPELLASVLPLLARDDLAAK